jgi:hypothetical protein
MAAAPKKLQKTMARRRQVFPESAETLPAAGRGRLAECFKKQAE